jgi:hypothetical protein
LVLSLWINMTTEDNTGTFSKLNYSSKFDNHGYHRMYFAE